MISTGAYGYPKEEALEVAVSVISGFLLKHEMMIYLVVFGKESLSAGKKLFRDIRIYIDDVYADTHLDACNQSARYLESLQSAAREDAFPDFSLQAAPRADSWPKKAAKSASPVSRPSFDARESFPAPSPSMAAPLPALDKMLREADEGFPQALMRLIDEKGMTDAQCYKKANVDRKLFSKIRSNPEYHPSKPTVFAFAVALELSLPETKSLLQKAGFALTHSSRFDIILEYFIVHHIYNIYEINEILFDYDLPLLGNSSYVA